MIDAVRANDDGRCCTDVVPLTPMTNFEFARASQSQTVVVSESQSLNVGVLANQTLYFGASMPSKYSDVTPGNASSIARANARLTGAESCVEIEFQAPPVVISTQLATAARKTRCPGAQPKPSARRRRTKQVHLKRAFLVNNHSNAAASVAFLPSMKSNVRRCSATAYRWEGATASSTLVPTKALSRMGRNRWKSSPCSRRGKSSPVWKSTSE